jgi:glycosyltransferase involved in cell wall biosynthesis
MTQVLNGYLAWQFPRVDVGVIQSRGDPHDLRSGAVHGARALLRVLRLPRDSSIVVGHLSERGSFVREGALLRLARARGIGTVAHLHGSSFAAFAATRPRLTAWALRAADRVISLSEESSRVAARFVPPGRIHLIPNAIPSAELRAKTNLVVFGGVVTHRKGIDVLQEAWERVAAPDWRLVIAGPIVDAPLVRSGLPAAEFRGAIEHEELLALLDEAAIAVLPSREEAMPMFILEAMARECAVVSTNVGGIAAVLADGAGEVVPVGDVDALAGSLADLIGDEAKRCLVAETGQRVFEKRFSADAVFPRIESVWRDAIATRAQQ